MGLIKFWGRIDTFMLFCGFSCLLHVFFSFDFSFCAENCDLRESGLLGSESPEKPGAVGMASLTRTRLASQTLSRLTLIAIQPSHLKFSSCPDGAFVTIHPAIPEVAPMARSRAQPLKLI